MKIIWIILMGIFIVFINYYFTHPNMFVAEEKRCSADEDCAFAPVKCCPGCEGYDSFNKNFTAKIGEEFASCSKDCPKKACYSPMGFIVLPRPACNEGRCEAVGEIQCNAVCAYYREMDRDVLSKEYLQKATEYLNASHDDLIEGCKCLNNTDSPAT